MAKNENNNVGRTLAQDSHRPQTAKIIIKTAQPQTATVPQPAKASPPPSKND